MLDLNIPGAQPHARLPVELAIIPHEKQAQAKAAYIENLGPANSSFSISMMPLKTEG